MANSNPDSKEIFECNLVDNFYPNRPCELENVCLYDFVKWYIYNGNDSNGQRINKKLIKSRLPNHCVYDPSKENEKDYFYSLLLLFHPFRNESDLIAKD